MAFEIRKLGFKVVFQPKSIVVHFEGISNGTDTNSGIKSYQVKNMENFLDKWKYTLDKEHFENANNLFLARDRSANKKTILVIDHYVPHYDQDAGGRSTFQYLKLFVEMGFNVKFLGDNFYKHEPYTTILEQMGIEVLYGVWYRDNYEKWIKNNATNINYVYLNRPHISIKYIELIRTHTNAKILYFGHDLHYLREQRQAQIEGNQELLKSSEQIKKIEMQVISRADIVYYPSIIEIEEIKKQFPDIKAKVLLAWMYERIEWSNENDFEKRKDLLFVGGFSHPPNLDGVLWFLKEIYPNILKHLPDIRFFIVGSNPPEQLLKLKSENIIITGYVSDLELSDYYNKCRLVVVPLRYGAGVKGKVVEAMYYQLPVITTSIGAEGIEDIEKTVIVEDEAKAFSERIIEIYNDYSKLNDMSKKSVEYINNYYSTDVVKANILKDFHDL
jgi:glycosyltransferase involved in cell wall biosynthesis